MNLVRAELLKLRTTSLWWVFGLILLPLWAASVLVNWVSSRNTTVPPPDSGLSEQQVEQIRAAGRAINVATNLYTSGQFMGVLLVLLLSAIVVTNEYFHQTATTTFLVTPKRQNVVLAKFVAGLVIALVCWAVTTIGNLIVVPFILRSLHFGNQLDEPAVWRAIGLNALAFGLWAILGVGAGVLIRSQLGATLTLAITYLIGTSGVGLVFFLLTQYVADWFSKLQVLVPTTASQLMISGTELPGNPPRWVGAVVLIAYALVMGLLGTAIMKRRDIS
jgi:ABC-type transport system involved in multi-copper enzyme maturation permease subunit